MSFSHMFESSAEQRRQLLDHGFVLLPGALPADLLARWRDLATRLEAAALEAHEPGDSWHGACVIEDPVGCQLMRQDDIHGFLQ